ncbi:LuxR C-terminal-related transcriptional regulator [Streptomyces sp. NPDC060022]|uniref:LuxR C-terminal-related transcriptional regulator n=1 Tax=Streptomyces sp. NPDC060022 TaxID=3347039 RepID=UPI003681F593
MTERISGTREAPAGPESRQPLDRAREAVSREAWGDAYRMLHGIDPDLLAADDLVALADAAWWTSRVDESVAVRTKAYSRYADRGESRQAGHCAWMLFYEHQLAGRNAAAAGWLHRARQRLGGEPECVEQCYLARVDAEEAQNRGAFREAMDHARRMAGIARRCGSADLLALSTEAEAGVLLAEGRVAEGIDRLDDVMCAVAAGELSAFFTGWIFCLGLQQCMACADLDRAAEWTEAAMAWCATMPEENNFRGLCRVHRVEVLELRGSWSQAATEAALTCKELLPYEALSAAEAVYLEGEIQRRRGDTAAAGRSYARAHELGRDPQPGLALLLLAQGRTGASEAALRVAIAADGGRHRGRLLAAQVEILLALGRLDEARTVADELAAVAREWQRRRESDRTPPHATAAWAGGAVAFAEHDLPRALPLLHRALSLWLDLGVPYEAAQTRMTLAAADRAAGDDESARLELRAAHAAFEALGAVPDARRAAALLKLPGRLTGREVEVLRLVAGGRTNRAVAAELTISEHTVARHLNNIFAKIDVSSRAAATAYAYTHGLVAPRA